MLEGGWEEVWQLQSRQQTTPWRLPSTQGSVTGPLDMSMQAAGPPHGGSLQGPGSQGGRAALAGRCARGQRRERRRGEAAEPSRGDAGAAERRVGRGNESTR